MALIRALPLKDFRAAALSTTDASTAYQFGALTTGQQLYAALHLTSVAGGTTARVIVMTVQSATASGFGSPTTQITSLTRSTAVGAQWATPVGSLSTEHTWWRAQWTMSTAASTAGTWKGLVYMGMKAAP